MAILRCRQLFDLLATHIKLELSIPTLTGGELAGEKIWEHSFRATNC